MHGATSATVGWVLAKNVQKQVRIKIDSEGHYNLLSPTSYTSFYTTRRPILNYGFKILLLPFLVSPAAGITISLFPYGTCTIIITSTFVA